MVVVATVLRDTLEHRDVVDATSGTRKPFLPSKARLNELVDKGPQRLLRCESGGAAEAKTPSNPFGMCLVPQDDPQCVYRVRTATPHAQRVFREVDQDVVGAPRGVVGGELEHENKNQKMENPRGHLGPPGALG